LRASLRRDGPLCYVTNGEFWLQGEEVLTNNRAISNLAAALSVAGAFCLCWLIYDRGANATAFWLTLAGGVTGMLLGLVDRRAGKNTANAVGLFLGTSVSIAFALLFIYFTMGTSSGIQPT
jgi:hypothetical protein